MALFGADTAIVSLGISCQTAHQLEEHEGLISQLLGAPVERRSTPLDWLLAGQEPLARMLATGRFFPEADDVFEFIPTPHWIGMNVHYLHDWSIRIDPGPVRAKFDHTTASFDRIKHYDRKVFIVSNSQNELPTRVNIAGEGWHLLDDAGVTRVGEALRRRFGKVELYVVSYADRHAVTTASADGVFELAPDTTRWRGDATQWAKVLTEILGARPAN